MVTVWSRWQRNSTTVSAFLLRLVVLLPPPPSRAMPGRFDSVKLKALLSTTPPLAVRLNLHSDVLEESALRSTTDGTLSSAIAELESSIAPHREKLAAGRMLPAAAFVI